MKTRAAGTVRIAMWAAYERRDGQWVGRGIYLLTGKVLTELRIGDVQLLLVDTGKAMYVVRREPRWPATMRHTDRDNGDFVTTVWRTDEGDLVRKHPALAEVLGLEPLVGLSPLDSLGLDVGEGISVDVVSWDEEETGPA